MTLIELATKAKESKYRIPKYFEYYKNYLVPMLLIWKMAGTRD